MTYEIMLDKIEKERIMLDKIEKELVTKWECALGGKDFQELLLSVQSVNENVITCKETLTDYPITRVFAILNEDADDEEAVSAEIINLNPIKVKVMDGFDKQVRTVGIKGPATGSEYVLTSSVLGGEHNRQDNLRKKGELPDGAEQSDIGCLTPCGERRAEPYVKSPDLSGLNIQQKAAVRNMLEPGWHGLCGGPGCGKSYTLARTAAELIRSGRTVVLIASGNQTLLDLYNKIMERLEELRVRIDVGSAVLSYTAALSDDLERFVSKRFREPFTSWRESRGGAYDGMIPTGTCLVVATAGSFIQGTKRAKRLVAFALEKKVSLIIEEASQVDFVSLFGLVSMAPVREHIIFGGDPWQVSKVESSPDGYERKLSQGSVLHMMAGHLEGKSNLLEEYMDFVKLGFSWSFLTVSYRLPNFLCRFGNSIYKIGNHSPGLTGRKVEGKPEDFLRIETITNADVTSQIFYSGSRANLVELVRVHQIIGELLAKNIKIEDVVVLCPFTFMVTITRRFLEIKGINVRVESIHKFNGQEAPVIIAAMVGGTAFLNSVPLVNSVTTRCKHKMYLLLSSCYELLPADHALTLYRSCFPECEVRVSIDENLIPWEMNVEGQGRGLKNYRATSPENSTELLDQGKNWTPTFYDAGTKFHLHIFLYHTVAESSKNVSRADGNIWFKFTVNEGDETYEGELCKATGFDNSSMDGEGASKALFVQQLTKLAVNLVPSAAFSQRYAIKDCVINLTLFYHHFRGIDAPYFISKGLQALGACSAIHLYQQVKHGQAFSHSGKQTAECLNFFFNELIARTEKMDLHKNLGAIYANHHSVCVYFADKGQSPRFTGIFECVNQAFPRGDYDSLGQSVFMEMSQGNRSFGWTHESVKSLLIAGGFLAAWLKPSEQVTLETANRNAYSVVCKSIVIGQDLWTQRSDHVHALEWRCLGALAVLDKFNFPVFRLVTSTSQKEVYRFIRWYLARVSFNFRGADEKYFKEWVEARNFWISSEWVNPREYRRLNQAAWDKYTFAEETAVTSQPRDDSDDARSESGIEARAVSIRMIEERASLQELNVAQLRENRIIATRLSNRPRSDRIIAWLVPLLERSGIDASRILARPSVRKVPVPGEFSYAFVEVPKDQEMKTLRAIQFAGALSSVSWTYCANHQFAEAIHAPHILEGGPNIKTERLWGENPVIPPLSDFRQVDWKSRCTCFPIE
jgi:hypothetical protein